MSTLLFSPEALEERIKTLVPELTEARHDIHQHPELGFEETRTQAKVKAYLESLGYAPCVSAETGLVADVRPDLGPPRLALRADLDCLPMQEDTDLPYKSVHGGRAHKCGHDGHTAVLMGVAKMLAEVRDSLSANVRLLLVVSPKLVNRYFPSQRQLVATLLSEHGGLTLEEFEKMQKAGRLKRWLLVAIAFAVGILLAIFR